MRRRRHSHGATVRSHGRRHSSRHLLYHRLLEPESASFGGLNLLGSEPSPSDATLRTHNIRAGVLHLCQALLMLAASLWIDGVKDFRKPLTTNYLIYDERTHSPVNRTRIIGSIQIGVLVASYSLVAATSHALVIVWWRLYLRDINRGINRYRWLEYAVSSSIMVCAIAMLFGCSDLSSLMLIGMMNSSMNCFGLLMELMNSPNRAVDATRWEPFWFGTLAGAAPWIVVLQYFYGGGGDFPRFVYAILVGYMSFAVTFPVNMTLQYSRIGRWREYRFGELVYITLSLLSKSFLACLVFIGTFAP